MYLSSYHLSVSAWLSVYQPLVSSLHPFFVCLNRNIILVSHYTIYRKVTLLAAKRVGRPLGNGESSGRKFYKIFFVVPRMTWVPWYRKKKTNLNICFIRLAGMTFLCLIAREALLYALFGDCLDIVEYY